MFVRLHSVEWMEQWLTERRGIIDYADIAIDRPAGWHVVRVYPRGENAKD